ncbi:hypothetical protein C8F01DRAFT_500797 [Mycena amicta]|nr:hypothetical protein C8F01DRAFT_500797 [Mycena amicta]
MRSHYSPLLKILLAWLAAAVLAVGHHAFNSSLNGQVVGAKTSRISQVNSQAGASAVGTTFAFLVSAMLGVTAATAFLQCAWHAVRKRSFTVGGLDALWSSPHNALAFLSLDFWRAGRGVVLVAAISWAFPLVVTFAPGTLSVNTDISTENQSCSVPTFDLSASTILHEEVGNALLSYTHPSVLSTRTVSATVFGGQHFPQTSPCVGNLNCTYELSVRAPSFSCSLGVSNASALTWNKNLTGTAFDPPPWAALPFDASPPKWFYSGWDLVGHYSDYQGFHPISVADPNSDDFIREPGNNFTCITYNSTYHLTYSFASSASGVSIDRIDLDQPASQLVAPYTVGDNSENGTFIPNTEYHSAVFNATTNAFALVSSLYTILTGLISVTESLENANFFFTPDTLSVLSTHLPAQVQSGAGNITWFGTLPSLMESLLQNITLSVLTLDATQTTTTTCVYSNLVPRFSYNARRLWLVYGLGLGCALLCDIFGVAALWQNKFGATGGFSDFLAATRNAELNEVDLDGKKPVRLRYGPLRDAGGRFAFAQPESLAQSGFDARRMAVGRIPVEEKIIGRTRSSSVFSPETLYTEVR